MRVNWLAILIAGIADWLLGAVWFTAFSKQWQAGLRMSPEELQMYMSHPNFWPYLIALLCSCLMAYAIARLVRRAPTHGLFRGIHAGILVGLAAAVAMITEMVFEYRAAAVHPDFRGLSVAGLHSDGRHHWRVEAKNY